MSQPLDVLQLAEQLGVGILVPASVQDISGVQLIDGDEPDPGMIVLAPGYTAESDRESLVRSCIRSKAAALLLTAPVSNALRVLAAENGLLLAQREPSLRWDELLLLLREKIDQNDPPKTVKSEVSGQQLFELADALALLLEAATTIEDTHSGVLAFSAGSAKVDAARISTILARKVPQDYLSFFRTSGVFRRIANEHEPFIVGIGPDEALPRLVIPLRLGTEVLGSIWALRDDLPGPAESTELKQLTERCALAVFQLQIQEREEQNKQTAQIRKLLIGEPPAGLQLPEGPWQAVALGDNATALETTTPQEPGDSLSIWGSFLRKSGWAVPQLGTVGPQIFAVVGHGQRAGSWEWLKNLISSSGPSIMLTAVAGRAVDSPAKLALSVLDAQRILDQGGASSAGIASYEENWPNLALNHLARELVSWIPNPPLKLPAKPSSQQLDLLRTLHAWLGARGDIVVAGGALHVHPNTVRLRLAKLRQLSNLDLDDTLLQPLVLLWARAELSRLEESQRSPGTAGN